VTLHPVEARAAQGDTLIERHVITDFGRLADDHAGGVVYEHALAEHGSRMDVDPCEQARQLRARPRQELEVVLPQPVADAVAPDGVDARVADRDLERRARSRVAVSCRP